jgi:hypothetical protein
MDLHGSMDRQDVVELVWPSCDQHETTMGEVLTKQASTYAMDLSSLHIWQWFAMNSIV